MADEKLRAWWFFRQGLGAPSSEGPRSILEKHGWVRSVGGVNPYLALFARGARSRADIDAVLAKGEIHELPSARGCTYVLPQDHYSLGLQVGRAVVGEGQDLKTARTHLGVTDKELERLDGAVLKALAAGPLDPKEIKAKIGDAARTLGDEGKKRGVATTLPLALGALQSQGRIRRIPVDGRFDSQRFKYGLWSPSRFENGAMDDETAFQEFAKLYFRWIGPATVKQFQWFSGLSLGRAKSAVASLDLIEYQPGSDLLMFREDKRAFDQFESPAEQQVVLVGSIDPLFHLRRDLACHLDQGDLEQPMQGDRALYRVGTVQDLTHHAIVDRGRIIGLWEYDRDEGEVVWKTFNPPSRAVKDAVQEMETFVRDQLGDARSFSLDSPESRKTRLQFLRAS